MKQNLADKTYAKIKKYGWIQEELADTDWDGKLAGLCMLGGLGEAAFKNPEMVETKLGELYSPACRDVTRKNIDPKFNDAIATVEAFREAICSMFPQRLHGASRKNPLDVIVCFNDHDDTTEDDVRMVCKKASSIINKKLVLSGVVS